MSYLPIEPSVLIIGLIATLFSALYLREYFLRKKEQGMLRQISVETRQKTTELLTAAQAAETQVIAQSNYTTKKLIEEFKTKLEEMVKNSQSSITASQDVLIKFMNDLQKRSVEFEEASGASTEQRIGELFEKLESKLSDFLITTEQKTTSSIELELKAARELIETYKNGQLKLIDENIIAMMEQTLNIVLAKKLSLKDQLDLVYEALERAKIEKFVV